MRCAITGCGNSPTLLFSTGTVTGGVAVDATDVYVTTPQAVMKCAISGCNHIPTVVASSADPTYIATGIRVDTKHVFWLNTSQVAGTGQVWMLAK